MRVSLKAALAAAAMLLGLSVSAVPSEARTTFYGGGGGITVVRDHGHGFGHRGFYGGGPRRHYGGPFVGGGTRYYRHGGYYRGRGVYRDRGFYGRRSHYDRGGPRFYGRHHHYRGNGVVIRLR